MCCSVVVYIYIYVKSVVVCWLVCVCTILKGSELPRAGWWVLDNDDDGDCRFLFFLRFRRRHRTGIVVAQGHRGHSQLGQTLVVTKGPTTTTAPPHPHRALFRQHQIVIEFHRLAGFGNVLAPGRQRVAFHGLEGGVVELHLFEQIAFLLVLHHVLRLGHVIFVSASLHDALVGLILFQTLLGPNGEFDKHAARFDLVVIASDLRVCVCACR